MLIHPGRVGSTVLASYLCALPIFVAGEIHNPKVCRIEDWASNWDYIGLFEHLLSNAVDFGSPYVTKVAVIGDYRAYLFEFKPFHYGCGEAIQDAVDKFSGAGVTDFVFLHRENYLRRYVSFQVAVSSGIWHTSHSVTSPHKVYIDPVRCSDSEIGKLGGSLVELTTHYYQNFLPSVMTAIRDRSHLILSYERHIERDPIDAFLAVRDFLGIDNPTLPIDLGYRRQNNFPLAEMIENYDEVADVLRKANFGHLLDLEQS